MTMSESSLTGSQPNIDAGKPLPKMTISQNDHDIAEFHRGRKNFS
jgi:hypothetical protein